MASTAPVGMAGGAGVDRGTAAAVACGTAGIRIPAGFGHIAVQENILPAGDAEGILTHIVCGAALTLHGVHAPAGDEQCDKTNDGPHQQGNANLGGIENIAAVIGWLVVRVVDHVIPGPRFVAAGTGVIVPIAVDRLPIGVSLKIGVKLIQVAVKSIVVIPAG